MNSARIFLSRKQYTKDINVTAYIRFSILQKVHEAIRPREFCVLTILNIRAGIRAHVHVHLRDMNSD